MPESRLSKKEWVLTQGAFDKLLLWLDQDAQRAGEKYEKIREKLQKFFAYRGAASPKDQADETINRVTRRISEGIETPIDDPYIFFLGVAQNVLKEHWRNPERVYTPLEDLSAAQLPLLDPGDIERELNNEERLTASLQCLERCLQQLPPESRELITQYYQGEKRLKIDSREELAARFGLSANALRIRVCRIREKVEDCIKSCLKRSRRE